MAYRCERDSLVDIRRLNDRNDRPEEFVAGGCHLACYVVSTVGATTSVSRAIELDDVATCFERGTRLDGLLYIRQYLVTRDSSIIGPTTTSSCPLPACGPQRSPSPLGVLVVHVGVVWRSTEIHTWPW